jgi:hypothetical protein
MKLLSIPQQFQTDKNQSFDKNKGPKALPIQVDHKSVYSSLSGYSPAFLSRNKINIANKISKNKDRLTYELHSVELNDILAHSTDLVVKENLRNPKSSINPIMVKYLDENKIKIFTGPHSALNSNDSKDVKQIAEIEYKYSEKLPEISVLTGNFDPVIKVKDKKRKLQFTLLNDSSFEIDNLKIKVGDNPPEPNKSKKDISFSGNINFVLGYKGKKVNQSIENYFVKNKFENVRQGKYVSKLKNDYNIMGLTAGYGTRLHPVSVLSEDSKCTTSFPGSEKEFMEHSILDIAVSTGIINPHKVKSDILNKNETLLLESNEVVRKTKDASIVKIFEDPDNLSGDLKPIIKGLKSGIIPMDKPLLVVPADLYTNADISKCIYDFENSHSGFMMPVKAEKYEKMKGFAPIKLSDDKVPVIEQFFPKVNDLHHDNPDLKQTEIKSGEYKGKYPISGTFFVFHPKVLEVMVALDKENKPSSFISMLDKMRKLLNTKENLKGTFDKEEFKKLQKMDLIDKKGFPKPLLDKDNQPLKMTASYLVDIDGNVADAKDIGTVSSYLDISRNIKNKQETNGLNESFINSVSEHISDSGVVFMDKNAKDAYKEFEQEYGAKNISGNVIVSLENYKNRILDKPAQKLNALNIIKNHNNPHISQEDYTKALYNITSDEKQSDAFIATINKTPQDGIKNAQKLMDKMGKENFSQWYFAENGYYNAYERYTKKSFKKAKSVDDLFKIMPNWGPWKLQEKYSSLNKTNEPFKVGQLPSDFGKEGMSDALIKKLRSGKDFKAKIDGNVLEFKTLQGGYLHNKYIYSVKSPTQEYILKLGRIDFDSLNKKTKKKTEKLSPYESEILQKNCYLQADSVYLDFCVDKYLQMNGNKSVPAVHYYDHKNHLAIYEKVGSSKDDLFQTNYIDHERTRLDDNTPLFDGLAEMGIQMNDRTYRNILSRDNGEKIVVDTGYANFVHVLKPSIQEYHIAFPNICGPDLSSIYAGMFLADKNKKHGL